MIPFSLFMDVLNPVISERCICILRELTLSTVDGVIHGEPRPRDGGVWLELQFDLVWGGDHGIRVDVAAMYTDQTGAVFTVKNLTV